MGRKGNAFEKEKNQRDNEKRVQRTVCVGRCVRIPRDILRERIFTRSGVILFHVFFRINLSFVRVEFRFASRRRER